MPTFSVSMEKNRWLQERMQALGVSFTNLSDIAGKVTRYIPIPQPTLLVGPGSSGRLGQAWARAAQRRA